MAPRFVVTGTGRSGSGYIAKVLNAAGVKTGAESWWNPYGKRDETIIGESSCCALAAGLDDYDGQVFYQVRHPLDTIMSMVRVPVRNPHLTLLSRLTPDANLSDMLDFAMHFWLACAQEAQRLDLGGWRVERVDARLVRWLGKCIGIDIGIEQAQTAVDEVPHNFNQHYADRRSRLTWDDLYRHDRELASRISDHATGYGYD